MQTSLPVPYYGENTELILVRTDKKKERIRKGLSYRVYTSGPRVISSGHLMDEQRKRRGEKTLLWAKRGKEFCQCIL